MNSSLGIALLLLSLSGVEQFKMQLVNMLNNYRLEFAKKEQIANMHAVTYDHSLDSKIKKMTCDELESPGPDYVVMPVIQIEIKGDLMKSPSYHPLQTKVACETTTCNDKLACVMGPKNSPPKRSDIKRGSPGSGCSGGNGLSGLCIGGSGGSAVENVPAEKQSGKKSGDSDVESKG
ncbi:hypothetical protein CRE_09893 [Caenorhabditis remanei]|uniref:Uncharacterized protein n=1 Tax=Caenorhabditis remanei TaxID=31234 RepID=E3NMQ0_CAERE|nr:hypothetical protein CRE_09893 [Caenorhabditis remanei]